MESPMTTDGHKLITCLLPCGVALPLARALKSEKGIVTAHIGNARGVGKFASADHRRLGGETEKQILTVVVDEQDAEDIFTFIYFEAEINRPHGGLIFMSRADKFIPLILPDVPEERA